MPKHNPPSYDGFSERTLIEKCLIGEADAFEPIYKRYHDELMGIAYHLLGNIDSAEEATQEAFYRAYKSLRQFKTDRPFIIWLRRILVNYCLLLKKRLRRERPLPESGPEIEPGRYQSQDILFSLLKKAIDQLPPKQRAAIVLRDMKSYPLPEVAEILGVKESTVRVNLFHARNKLGKTYNKLEKQFKELSL